MFIPPSELIINPDSSVYHLKLRPDEIADLILTVGDPDRVDKVARHLDKIHLDRRAREFRTITGELGSKLVTIISTGIGTDNIDIVFNELDALANVDFSTRKVKEKFRQLTFIRLGTSGAIQAEIPLDSFISSAHAIGLDGLLSFYQSEGSRNHDLEALVPDTFKAYAVDADKKLLTAFSSFTKPGLTITANGFYGPQSRSLRIKSTFSVQDLVSRISYQGLSPTNLEMETAGIYGLAKLLGHRAISLNAILANRVTNEFSSQPAQTIDTLIEKSMEVVEVI